MMNEESMNSVLIGAGALPYVPSERWPAGDYSGQVLEGSDWAEWQVENSGNTTATFRYDPMYMGDPGPTQWPEGLPGLVAQFPDSHEYAVTFPTPDQVPAFISPGDLRALHRLLEASHGARQSPGVWSGRGQAEANAAWGGAEYFGPIYVAWSRAAHPGDAVARWNLTYPDPRDLMNAEGFFAEEVLPEHVIWRSGRRRQQHRISTPGAAWVVADPNTLSLVAAHDLRVPPAPGNVPADTSGWVLGDPRMLGVATHDDIVRTAMPASPAVSVPGAPNMLPLVLLAVALVVFMRHG